MSGRTIEVNGERWEVFPSGRVTVYQRDEFGLVFQRGSGTERVRRFARYAPLGPRRWDAALAGLSDGDLTDLFHHSQPEWTSPDGRMSRALTERVGR
jgi:hypothetical protein